MSLVRSPAAGHESARRFYSAFYLWSRLTSPQSHVKSSRQKHIYSKRTSRNYSTTAAPTPTTPTTTTTTPPTPTKQTVTLLLNNTDHALLTQWQNANLKIIAKQTGAHFDLGDSDKFPKDGLHRLFVHGTPDTIFAFSRVIMEVSSSGKPPDGGRKKSLSRKPLTKDTTNTSKIDKRKTNIRKTNIRKTDTRKVDTPKFDTSKVDTLVVSAGASDEVARKDISISSTDKRAFKHRTAYLTPLEQSKIHILTESLLDAIKAESGVRDLTISSQYSPLGHPQIRVQGSKSARALAIKGVQDALRDVAPPPPPTILDNFRQAMRSVPSPVAVLTARLATVEDKKASFRGMTVSSFTAVSVHPEPIISFNIRTPSRTFDALDTYGKFYLHIPAANVLGKTIADAFTKPHADPTEAFRDLSAKGNIVNEQHHQHLPVLRGHGIQARYLCQLLKDKTVSIGDHVVLFAKVKDVYKAKVHPGAKHPPAGLAYVHGKYSRATELVDHDSEQALKLPDDEYTPMLTPEQIMAQIVDPILNSKSEQQVSESNEPATGKESTSKPSGDSEAEKQRLQDMNERYFTSAEEYEADDHIEDVDIKCSNETSSSFPTNPHVSAKSSTSATIPTGTCPFSTFHRPATTTTTLGLSSTCRTISTSTTPPPTSTTTDPAILSQTVESYIYQAFDPETGIYKRKHTGLPTRVRQRQTLDKCTRRLQFAYEDGEIDDEALQVLGGKVEKLRADLMRMEMDTTEYKGFVAHLTEALDEVGGVSASATGNGEAVNGEGVNEEEVEEGVEEEVEEVVEKKDTDMEFEATTETGEERRTEITKEVHEHDHLEKKDIGIKFEEMMDKRQE